MSTPSDRSSLPPVEPETDQERELSEAHRELDEADRVLVWSFILTELGRRPSRDEE